MSHERVRETSVDDAGSALLNGLSACSSRSRMAGFSGPSGRCQPNARKREPKTEEGVIAAARKENTTRATATKIKIDNTIAMLTPEFEPLYESQNTRSSAT